LYPVEKDRPTRELMAERGEFTNKNVKNEICTGIAISQPINFNPKIPAITANSSTRPPKNIEAYKIILL
jgi:hypothetical protein